MPVSESYIPFSQRSGLEPFPPQLELGVVSSELRRLIGYYIDLEIDREAMQGFDHSYFEGSFKRLVQDLHVVHFGNSAKNFENKGRNWAQLFFRFTEVAPIGKLFDFLEFVVRHPNCSKVLSTDLASAFVTARAAYRIIDRQIVAIGTEEQAAAFVGAIDSAGAVGAIAARSHLVSAGRQLKDGDWAATVRESIHAVEALALLMVPDSRTLGPALKQLEEAGHLHGGLKAAFGQLYGYSSDEEGIRHAKVFSDEAKVDETDALFMVGACSAFVSYLATRYNK